MVNLVVTPHKFQPLKRLFVNGAWGDADQEYLLGLDAINVTVFGQAQNTLMVILQTM